MKYSLSSKNTVRVLNGMLHLALSNHVEYVFSSWHYIQLHCITEGVEGIQRREIKIIKSLDLCSL